MLAYIPYMDPIGGGSDLSLHCGRQKTNLIPSPSYEQPLFLTMALGDEDLHTRPGNLTNIAS